MGTISDRLCPRFGGLDSIAESTNEILLLGLLGLGFGYYGMSMVRTGSHTP